MKKIFFIGAAVLAMCCTSCKKDNTPDTANGKAEITVASESLVAYFPMEDATEDVAKLSPVQQGTGSAANFVAGRTGKCYQGTAGSYLLYDLPASSPIKSMQGFTYSMWVNQPEIPNEQAAVPMYFQITKSDDHYWGNLSVSIDRTEAGAGYLTLKTCFYHGSDGSIWKTYNDNYNQCWTAGRWIHVIYTYDSVTSQFHAYCNGIDVTPADNVDCVMSDQPAGALAFANAEQIMIGTWMTKLLDGATDEWMGDLTNVKVDEVRLYNRALTAAEAQALYKAEVANID